MTILLGPILQFDGATDDLWRFRITLLAHSEPVVQVVEGGTVSRMAVLADFESV